MSQLDTGYGAWFGETEGDEDNGGKVSEEALEYLRSVNSEAAGLGPISARNASRLEDQHVSHAYFDDNAWISLDARAASAVPQTRFRTLADAQEHFLLKSMLALRAALRTGTATTNTLGPAPTRTKLREHMIARDAAAPELRNMARETQLNAVRELTERLAWGALTGAGEGRRLQGWLFGVLARLEDAGALFLDDVNVVRMLGKRALRVAVDQVRALEKGAAQTPEDAPARAPKRQRTARNDGLAQNDGSNDGDGDAMSMSDGEISDGQPMSMSSSSRSDSDDHNEHNEHNSDDNNELDEHNFAGNNEHNDNDSDDNNESNDHGPDGNNEHGSNSDTDRIDDYALPAAPASSAGSAFASLDMVLTVVGRVYRQVDLLEKKRGVFTQVRY